MVKQFGRSNYPNRRLAAQTLSNLQQVSLELPDEEHVLPSLIVIQRNRQWWQTLAHGLDYAVPKWTLASIMSVVYVGLADLFTWINTLGGPLPNVVVNATGESISSLWLCFLPIVIGNLQLSPKTDSNRIRRAFDHANHHFFVATDEGPPEQAHRSSLINIRSESQDTIDEDELSSAPVYFYARAFTWIRVVRKVADGFDAASQHAFDHHSSGIPPSKREAVVRYCKSDVQTTSTHSYDFFSIFVRSALLALFLQWGTTGAAIMAMFLTPTKGQLIRLTVYCHSYGFHLGLGCRSASYLLYGMNSTLIWILCVLSSVLSHYYKAGKKGTATSTCIWGASLVLRLTAKCVAAVNAVWLFLTAIFQFSNLYDNCWCNSSKLALGSKAYTVISYSDPVLNSIKLAWAGGMVMALFTAALFLIALNVLRKRPAKEPESIPLQWMGPDDDL